MMRLPRIERNYGRDQSMPFAPYIALRLEEPWEVTIRRMVWKERLLRWRHPVRAWRWNRYGTVIDHLVRPIHPVEAGAIHWADRVLLQLAEDIEDAWAAAAIRAGLGLDHPDLQDGLRFALEAITEEGNDE
jgi:hypothetical protein